MPVYIHIMRIIMREVNEKHEPPLSLFAWKHGLGKSIRQKEVKKSEGNNVLLLPVIYLNLIVGDIVARFNLLLPLVFLAQSRKVKLWFPLEYAGVFAILAGRHW